MGLRTGTSLPATTAANQGNQGDFDSAFSSLLGEEETVESGEVESKTQEPPPKEDDPIDRIEENAKAAREKWKLQKEMKDLKAEIERLKTEGKKGISVDSDNPLKEIGKLKGWSKDDIVTKALEALEDDGMTAEEAKKEVKSLTEAEIIAKVKEELRKEAALEAEQNGKIAQTDKVINDFKSNIKKFAVENAEKYPLIDGLGGADAVYKAIEDDYLAKEEEFGIEYAQKNMLSVEEASKKINEMLAINVKGALKSDHVRKFILAALKEGGNKQAEDNQLEDIFQSQDEEPQTLTNSVHKKITDPKDSRDLTDEERFKQAFSYLD